MTDDSAHRSQQYLDAMLFSTLKGAIPTEQQRNGIDTSKLTIAIANYIKENDETIT